MKYIYHKIINIVNHQTLINVFQSLVLAPSKSPFLTNMLSMFEVKLVGKLIYLTQKRPDMSYALSVLARHMHQPHDLLWRAEKIILQYVQGTNNFGVHYSARA